jgi:multiple sugar transport system substrate-binding protein
LYVSSIPQSWGICIDYARIGESIHMGTTSYNRRQFCQLGLGGLTGLSLLDLAGCGTSSASGNTTLQLSFWGPSSRNQLTKKTIQLFQSAHPNVTIHSSFTDFNTYWSKLDTQIAGGNVPDLMQMDVSYVAQFVQQNLLVEITPLVKSKVIDLSQLDPGLVENSKFNGKLYGVPLGGNYESMYYDTVLVQQAGMSPPPQLMTWDDFANYTRELSQALKKRGIFGTSDTSGDYSNFEVWVRQRGKNLYTADGKLGFEVTDLAEWFDYWIGLRKSGACASAAVQASAPVPSVPNTSLLTLGKIVFENNHSNQFSSFQQLAQHKLALQMSPTGSKPGLYNKPSQLMSISTKSKYQQDAAEFSNFFVNDPKSIQALGLDRGIPGNKNALNILSATISAADKESLEYTQMVQKSGQSSPLTILPPAGAGNFSILLVKISQQVAFGQVSASAGAQTFYTNMTKALG